MAIIIKIPHERRMTYPPYEKATTVRYLAWVNPERVSEIRMTDNAAEKKSILEMINGNLYIVPLSPDDLAILLFPHGGGSNATARCSNRDNACDRRQRGE